MWALFGRRAAVCFVLFSANGCLYREDVLLQKNTEFSVRLETLRLTMFRPVAPVLDATGKQFDLKRKHRVIFQVSFVFVLFLMVIGVVAACGDARWIGTSAVGLYLLFAELRRSSAATKAIHYLRLGDFETSSSFALDRIRLLRECRRDFMQNMQQSAPNQKVRFVKNWVRRRVRRRVRFAPEDKLCSFVLIKPYYEMSAEELGDCYDGRYMSNEFTNLKTQEVDWERQFEVFPSDDESVFCTQMYRMFVNHIPAFSEETFFVDEKGERCHPAHWTAFSRDILPYLRKFGHVPPGFGSWESYERHLVWYNKFYQKCITWYDYHFCGFPVEPLQLQLPQDKEDEEACLDSADVYANAADDGYGDGDSVDNQPDSFLETEAMHEHHFSVATGVIRSDPMKTAPAAESPIRFKNSTLLASVEKDPMTEMELDVEMASLDDPVDVEVDAMPSLNDAIDREVDAMGCLNKVAEPEVDAIAGSSVEIPVDIGLGAMPSFDGAIDTEVDAIPVDMGLGAMPSFDVAIDTEVDAMASSNKVAEPEVDAIAGSSVEIPVDMGLGAMPSFDDAIDTEADAMASSNKVAEPEVDAIAGSSVEIPVDMGLVAMPSFDDVIDTEADAMASSIKEAEPEVDAIAGSSVEIPVGMESAAMPALDDPVDMNEDAMPSLDHAMSKKKKSSVSCLRTRPYLERECKVVVCLRMRPYLPRQCKKNVRVLVVQ
jgi:hypothetical protein